MYGGSSSDIKATSNPMGIGVHKVKLHSVEAFTTEPNKAGDTYDVLDIKFINSAKEIHNIRSFSPDKDTDKERQKKSAESISKLVVYIASKLQNKEVAIGKVKSWADFTEEAKKSIVGTDALNLKLIGNVWQGKANVQVTKYFGWLERADAPQVPKMSPNELKGNAEYDAKIIGISSADAEDSPF